MKTNNRKVLGAISIARKAGKLMSGAAASEEALLKGAPLAIVTSDVSERTMRNITRAAKHDVVKLALSQYEIYEGTGVRFVAAAVTDENLAVLIKNSATEEA